MAAKYTGDIYTGHPSQKPIGLIIQLTKECSNPTNLILDPFCGSGTTCVAAKMLGRDYIGIDISLEYCKIAKERLNKIRKGCKLGLLDKLPKKKKRKGKLL